MARYCCAVCPNAVSCQDLTEIVFATPEDIMDFFDEPVDPATNLQRPACKRCHLELPVTGVCGECS